MRWLGYLLLLPLSVCAQQSGSAELARRAVEAHKRGDLPAAVRDYRKLLDGDAHLSKVRTNLAAALADMNRLDDAIQVLEATPADQRSIPDIERALALAYYQKQNFPSAAGELERLLASTPGDMRAISMLADCYIRTARADRAVALLAPVAKAHPADAELRYQFGTALVRGGKPELGLAELEEAGRLGKNADALLLAGATALDLGLFQRARQDLEGAISLNPAIPGAWTWTGMARDRVSDEEGAKDAFRKALQADPRDFEAMFHLGAILYRERDLEQARKYIDGALELQPSSVPARYARALVRSALGETENAVQDLEAVTAAAPNWVEPHVKLASLYFRLRRQADGQREKLIVDTLKSEHKEQQVSLPELDKP
jgi:tetratricopeptide (TPR) repeat protein